MRYMYGNVRRKMDQDFYLLGYKTKQFIESEQTFQRCMSPPSSGLNTKAGKR
jgi:hypothetical protein